MLPMMTPRGEDMRQRAWRLWDSHGWVVVGVGFLITFALGFTGFTRYDESTGVGWAVSTRAYLTIKLFTLEGGDLEGTVPWTLEVARWSGPLVVAGAAISTAATLLRRRAWGWGARRFTDHVVVVGLGGRGLRTARAVAEDGRDVLAIELDPDEPHVREARRLGIPVLIGDGADAARLRSARIDRARRMIVLVGDAEQGAAIADAVAALASEDPLKDEFCCYVSVTDAVAVREINGLLHAQGLPVRREFFSLEERAGTAIYDRWARLRVAEHPRVVVVGDTVTTRSVVATAARHLEALRTAGSASDLSVEWLVADADELRADLPGLHPLLGDGSVRVSVRSMVLRDTSSTVTEALESGEPSLVVVGQAADADVLAALTVAELRLRRTDAPVVAVTNGPRTLVTLVREHPRIEVFDVHAELCADDAIARGQLEAMARALHDGYLRQVEATLGTEERAAKPAYRTWDELSADLRGKNYSAARGIWGFLKECGYDVLPRSAGHDEVRAFPAATLHRLAGLEFTRWYRETHPGEPVPEWSSVGERDRVFTIDQMARVPVMLAAADLHVVDLGTAHGGDDRP